MSAAPAYSYYPERAPEHERRARISVVPGRGTRTQPASLPSNVVFLAKAVAVVLVVVALVAFVRIGLMSATVSTTMSSTQLSSQISDPAPRALRSRCPKARCQTPRRSSSRRASWAWPLLRQPA